MKKLMLLAAALAMVLMAAAPAVAQVGQEAEQDGESGDADQSFAVTGSGGNANQCAALLGGAQSGNSQNGVGVTQSDDSEADDFEFEDSGSNVALSPELAEECEQIINQAASASSAPKAARAPAPKAAAKVATPKVEEKKTEAKAGSTKAKAEAKKAEQKKELPKTGGSGTASLLALGTGALLVTGGLLGRRIFR